MNCFITGLILLISNRINGYSISYPSNRSNPWKQMYTARKSSSIGWKSFENHLSKHKIIIDTRTASERQEYDANKLFENLGQDITYVIVDYDNFSYAKGFFDSFKKGSRWYNSDNDGEDVDLFPSLPSGTVKLPSKMADKGGDILLICGQRKCGCRWNLMYSYGFRGHHYFNHNVNNYIKSLTPK